MGEQNKGLSKFYALSLLLLFWIPDGGAQREDLKSERPNIIVILADHSGYGALGRFGHPEIKTPNLDRLAAVGVKLINSYLPSAVCSASRAAIMTGRNPYRVGVYNWIPMMSPMHLPASELAIASVLSTEGYATCMVGKWHLNGLFNLPGQPQPDDFGFDHWFAV